MGLGQHLIKDIYEALRASPAWNETLLIVTYDGTVGANTSAVPCH